MARGRSFLIDTNVVIQLEDDKPVQAEFSEMMRRCQEHAVALSVHEASEEDVRRDRNPNRRAITLSKIAKFERIKGVSTPPEAILESRFGAIKDDHDRVDVLLLNALDRNAADFLVTEDLGIHRRARQAGLQDRVFRVKDALDWLIGTFEPQPVPLPYIVERRCYQLDKNDPIFDTLRQGYPRFDEWFEQAARRPCWCLEVGGQIAGVVIRKDDESRSETDATLPGSKILKVSTFKVKETFRGEKFGEHLLKQILWYAQLNRYDLVYLTAYADDQEILADLLQQYGFQPTAVKADGEQIYEKQMQRGPVTARTMPLADDLARYPCFREDDAIQVICVPIQPQWYRVLFPENAPQMSLLDASIDQNTERTPGNTIRKVYLCHAQMKAVNPGDILLFYLSGNEIGSGNVRTVGIVEKMTEISDPEALLRATGRRSVYTEKQQLGMLHQSRSPIKVVDFILVGHLKNAVPLELLNAVGALKGAPQSFTRMNKEAYRTLDVHALLGYA